MIGSGPLNFENITTRFVDQHPANTGSSASAAHPPTVSPARAAIPTSAACWSGLSADADGAILS